MKTYLLSTVFALVLMMPFSVYAAEGESMPPAPASTAQAQVVVEETAEGYVKEKVEAVAPEAVASEVPAEAAAAQSAPAAVATEEKVDVTISATLPEDNADPVLEEAAAQAEAIAAQDGEAVVQTEAATDAVTQATVETSETATPAAFVPADWGYTGPAAAPYWGMIKPDYSLCAAGKAQSPINIARFLQEDLPTITPAYQPTALSLMNDGHSLHVNLTGGGGFSVDGSSYALDHMVFHTPSEHYLDGAPYPMEMQLVHRDASGHTAIVSTMLKIGGHNPVIEGIWQNAPIEAGAAKTIDSVKITAGDLLPKALDYYKYEGSLTSPPCSEGVQWYILKEPIELSEIQLKAFQALFPVNARPVQPLNDRVIVGN